MKLALRYGGIALVALLIVSCGESATETTEVAETAEVETISYRSTFESITSNFDVEPDQGLKSLALVDFRYSGALNSKELEDFVANSTIIDFTVDKRDIAIDAEYKKYENAVSGVLTIGDLVVNTAFYFTNKGSEMISGILVFDTPEDLAFLESGQTTIMVKGRQ